ncbi:MAG TPA: Lrp/AsnC family transcriptional regulator [Thermoleophilia bacterium]|nr:Lrp/AsnC family transcriptional regulator [Thermoleophilia bacterium]
MPDKASSRRLDSSDSQILSLLSEDPRMSFAEMARRMGVSPGMVRQRYQRLHDEGVVRIAAITNPTLTGGSLMVVVVLKVDGGDIERIAAQIAGFDEVVYLVALAGSYDLLAEARFRDQDHLRDFLSDRLRRIEGVRDSETYLTLEIIKETYY